MALSKNSRAAWHRFLGVTLLFVAVCQSAAQDAPDYERKAEERFQTAQDAWLKAGSPGAATPAGAELVEAAIHDDEPRAVAQVLAGGDIRRRMLSIPHGGQRVTLQPLHTFPFPAHLEDEMFASLSGQKGWLARRMTKNAFEVWTAKHGWLFDGEGQLRHEAHPLRRTGWGREWYGAFLPDGKWVTTDLDEMDGLLRFYSSAGHLTHILTCEQLAPRPTDAGAKLLGWGRSDRNGSGWVVNVGSEQGWATVWIGPAGAARVLQAHERWHLCYPRALGPRGTGWHLDVPDDLDRIVLARNGAGHGPGVGYPIYTCEPWKRTNQTEAGLCVARGNCVFGFWPGKLSTFIGAENDEIDEASGPNTRKVRGEDFGSPTRVIDKTWLFHADGQLAGWVRGRRLADAADGRAMLFRLAADSRIVTLGADLKVKAVRHFAWKDGATGDAVALWDDLHLGLFIRSQHLVLAKWPG